MAENDTNTHSSEAGAPDSLTFEQGTARIEEIIRLLERGDAPLDRSLAMFEEGAMLIKTCGRMLDEAEQKVVFLQKDVNGEPEERPFDDEL